MAEAARSNYAQVRLTVTLERGGMVSARVMAKRPEASWTMRDTVWHHRFRSEREMRHWLDLLAVGFYQVTGEALPPFE